MLKVVFLTKGKADTVAAGKYDECVYASPVYRCDNKLCKAAANICWIFHLPFLCFFLGDWARNIKHYDIFICEGLKRREWVFHYLLNHKKQDSRVIMWHWNKIFEQEINPNSEIAQKCEQWSFDPDDCEKYNMHFNTQYFGTTSVPQGQEVKWDIYFLGTDKGRFPILEKLYMDCITNELKPYFHVVGNVNKNTDSILKHKSPISYEQNLENASHSVAILDMPLEGQRGLTLRVLEALYLQKKLITFNHDVQSLAFYNSNNVLICNSFTSITKIVEFLSKPYVNSKEAVCARHYYGFVEWAKRFL